MSDVGLTIVDLSAAFESSADMMLITERDVDGDVGWAVVYANKAFVQGTGYSRSELAGMSPSVFVRRGDRKVLDAAMYASHRDEDVQMDVPIARKDGTWFWGSWHARTIARDEGKRRRVITIRDISERIQTAQRIAAHSERLRQLHMVAASSGRSAERQIGAILEFGVNSFWMDLGYTGKIADGVFSWEHMIVGAGRDNPTTVRVGDQTPLEKMLLRRAIEANDVVAFDDLRVLGDHDYNPALRSYIGAPLIVRGHLHGGMGFASQHLRLEPFSDDDYDVMRLIAALCGSATERAIQERRLDELAFYDSLTHLPNRALLEDRLNQTLATARRVGRQFAVHMLDLDHFKEVNDRDGHAAGDEALQVIAKRFVAALRESDTLARLGGDEFVALQPVIENEGDAARLADRLKASLAEPVVVGGHQYDVGVTIGIAIFPRDGADARTLLRNADRALYGGKAEGRGRIEFAQIFG